MYVPGCLGHLCIIFVDCSVFHSGGKKKSCEAALLYILQEIRIPRGSMACLRLHS